MRTKARGWTEARRLLGRYPTIYFALGALRGRSFQDRKVSETTDIVIDGYPRSANSFAVGAFRQAQSSPVKVSHHLHVPAQIVRAVELDIPTILLIRHPVDSIISYRALHKEGEIVEREPRASLRMGFRPFCRSWIDFYQTTLPHVESVVIGRFQQVISDFGGIVRAVNSRFGENFTPFEHTEENVEIVNNARGITQVRPTDDED